MRIPAGHPAFDGMVMQWLQVFISIGSLLPTLLQISKCLFFLLTLYLSSVLVKNHLDAQFFFFRVYLFQFSTCFEHHCAHHPENQLHQNICYMSLYVGDGLVCRFGWHPNLHHGWSPTQSDIYLHILQSIIFINVYMVLFLFNNLIYVFLLL